MTARVAASPTIHASPHDIAGSCSAHDETYRINETAIDLQEMLNQCVGKSIERELHNGMCNNGHEHWAEVGSMKQCSCHSGFYSTAQIVANLLHLVVQLVAFPKPVCVEDHGVQTEARAETCSQSVQCDIGIPFRVSAAAQSGSDGRMDQGVQVNTVVMGASQEEKDIVPTCEQAVQTKTQTSAQQTQTGSVETRESTVQVQAETVDSDVQVTLMCQRCRRKSSKNHFCTDCTVAPRREVEKKDADVQAEEQCHCCFESAGKTTFCGVCLKVLKLNPPTEIDLCWECSLRIAFVKGGRCTVCVKTDNREAHQPNFPVRIGGGYDVLCVSHSESVQAYSEAAQETVRHDHNAFAHGAPGHHTLPGRFHVGVVFQPATSRKDSIEPSIPKTPRQRPKSAGDSIGRNAAMIGKVTQQRPQSAGVVSSGAARPRSQPAAGDASIMSEKAVERMMAQPRPRMWRVLGDNRPVRDPPPW